MQLLLVGKLNKHITEAILLAKELGNKILHSETVKDAIITLAKGNSQIRAIFISVEEDVANFIKKLRSEKIASDVFSYGLGPTSDKAIATIEAGAKDYLPLPPDKQVIAKIFASLSNGGGAKEAMICASPKMASVVEIAKKVASSTASIFITGKSGTGKEVMAKFIHNESNRKAAKFVSINCAAIPETLLESELFGHEKGAFTGATQLRIGKFEESSGGTLLLDEISEMNFALQAKLLRVIQEREVTRIGGNDVIKLDLRLIATSNRNMIQEVKMGNFREDLFFRLNVINIELPALNERKEDIPKLAKYFIDKFTEDNISKQFSQKAMDVLASHHWQGNVREFENTIHRAVLLSENREQIEEKDILLYQFQTDANTSTLAEIEKQAILSAYNKANRNSLYAADMLGISIDKMQDKLKGYGL